MRGVGPEDGDDVSLTHSAELVALPLSVLCNEVILRGWLCERQRTVDLGAPFKVTDRNMTGDLGSLTQDWEPFRRLAWPACRRLSDST